MVGINVACAQFVAPNSCEPLHFRTEAHLLYHVGPTIHKSQIARICLAREIFREMNGGISKACDQTFVTLERGQIAADTGKVRSGRVMLRRKVKAESIGLREASQTKCWSAGTSQGRFVKEYPLAMQRASAAEHE
ncbi:hypothetical protein SCLCIDRAFT_1222169 [Scleroderma citrinum Foug A]|uniref:Uncharacterized protein n=1 Tax=Scleroderma citrinum Foug A TaxID=1036808 RepID=A0A0C2YX92_9AGAM|nr:hypothetical protein SCLCIDRAFT_1222169 [Scleroderma citrinum Foug A]